MKRVERTNMVMIYLNQWTGFAPYNPYTMDMDRNNRNYYNCGKFRHLARNCKNKETGDRIRKGRRLKYESENNRQRRIIEEGQNQRPNNLNGDKNLIVLD